MRVYKYGGYGVDVQLMSYNNPSDVFWSEKCNSYVMVEPRDPERVAVGRGQARAEGSDGVLRALAEGWWIGFVAPLKRLRLCAQHFQNDCWVFRSASWF